jgi:hypothetical protein
VHVHVDWATADSKHFPTCKQGVLLMIIELGTVTELTHEDEIDLGLDSKHFRV